MRKKGTSWQSLPVLCPTFVRVRQFGLVLSATQTAEIENHRGKHATFSMKEIMSLTTKHSVLDLQTLYQRRIHVFKNVERNFPNNPLEADLFVAHPLSKYNLRAEQS